MSLLEDDLEDGGATGVQGGDWWGIVSTLL